MTLFKKEKDVATEEKPDSAIKVSAVSDEGYKKIDSEVLVQNYYPEKVEKKYTEEELLQILARRKEVDKTTFFQILLLKSETLTNNLDIFVLALHTMLTAITTACLIFAFVSQTTQNKLAFVVAFLIMGFVTTTTFILIPLIKKGTWAMYISSPQFKQDLMKQQSVINACTDTVFKTGSWFDKILRRK